MDSHERDQRDILFRYCTAALAGPWRNSVGEAVEDAIRTGQAVRDEAEPQGLRWHVPGRIASSEELP